MMRRKAFRVRLRVVRPDPVAVEAARRARDRWLLYGPRWH